MPSHKLRIVYMGTPDFAVLPLKRIIEAGFQVTGAGRAKSRFAISCGI